MQNCVPSIRITSIYVSQTSSVVFGCKTGSFGPELQVSMGLRPHLSFCACKTVSEILVSMCRSLHLWFLDAKEGLLDQNYKSLWVPDLTCRFVHAKQRDLHQSDKSILVPAFTCHSVHEKQRDLHQNDKSILVPAFICGFVHAKRWL